MFKNSANIFNFVNWLAEKYIRLEKQALPYALKIIDVIRKNKTLLIQFSGQSHIIEIEVAKLIEKNLFTYFSPSDIKIIFEEFYTNNTLTLSDVYFCNQKNAEMFVFADSKGNKRLNISAQDISSRADLINMLSPVDAHRAGFIFGVEQIKKIKNP